MTADIAKARREADRLLLAFAISDPPIDPEVMAEAKGIRVLYAEFAGRDALEYSGFFRALDNTIIVNKIIPPNRITFTIAHELGHSVLHQEYIKSNDYRPMPRTNAFASGKPKGPIYILDPGRPAPHVHGVTGETPCFSNSTACLN